MVRKLVELEKLLEPTIPGKVDEALADDSLCAEVVQSFGGGVSSPATLPSRLQNSPLSSIVLVAALSKNASGFWKAMEQNLFDGQKLGREDQLAISTAIRELAHNLGLSDHDSLKLWVNQVGLDQFKLRAHSDPKQIHLTLNWFGPTPDSLELVFANESWPWSQTQRLSLNKELIEAAATEVAVPLDFEPVPGRYEVYVDVPQLGCAALNREGQVRTALYPFGMENEIADHLANRSALELDLWKLFERAREVRKDVGRALRRLLVNFARENGVETLCKVFETTLEAPEGSLNYRTFLAIVEVLRRPELQAALASYLVNNPTKAPGYAANALPGASVYSDSTLTAEQIQALHVTPAQRALIALTGNLSPEELKAYIGELVDSWGEAEPGETRRITVLVEGREYRVVVENRDDDGKIHGVLPTVDDEDVEILLVPGDNGEFKLYPEIRSRSLLLSGDALVTNILESPLYKKKKIKRGLPVNQFKPVSAKIMGERKRPAATDLTAAMLDARRLALKASRRAVNELDQQIIAGLLSKPENPATPVATLDAAGYGRAMLEWALPLPVASQTWKQNLWAIDRETTALLGAGAELQAEGLDRIPKKAKALLNSLKKEMTASVQKPAPLALEKAVFQFALLARALTRVEYDSKLDDVYETFAKVETRMQLICPALLGYCCTLIELVLRDGAL